MSSNTKSVSDGASSSTENVSGANTPMESLLSYAFDLDTVYVSDDGPRHEWFLNTTRPGDRLSDLHFVCSLFNTYIRSTTSETSTPNESLVEISEKLQAALKKLTKQKEPHVVSLFSMIGKGFALLFNDLVHRSLDPKALVDFYANNPNFASTASEDPAQQAALAMICLAYDTNKHSLVEVVKSRYFTQDTTSPVNPNSGFVYVCDIHTIALVSLDYRVMCIRAFSDFLE